MGEIGLKTRRITSWDEVQLEDLFAAFRKAKADCFFERSAYVAEQFAAYESDLFENLQALLNRLRAGEVSAVLAKAQRHPGVFAKGVSLKPRGSATGADRGQLAAIQSALRSGDAAEAERLVQAALADEDIALPAHAFFSDADRAFERLKAAFEIVPEFRLVGDFDVDMHIVSGLWINCVGHHFDAKLSRHAFGSRVRRYAADRAAGQGIGAYQYEAVGTFEPYFQPYRRWRDEGLKAIDDALKAEDSVVALTLDFSSYYHSIDPRFMTDERFKAVIDIDLNDWETDLTKELISSIEQWGANAASQMDVQDFAAQQIGGIPIGLAAVRIITNVLLYEMDRAIVDALHPVYYGRYVDDVFLVIKDSGHIKSAEQLWDYISTCLPKMFKVSGEEVEVFLPGDYQGDTKLRLKPEKQRVFFLRGQAGRDLLSNIAHQVRTLSSERRLMPLVDEMDETASARALAAAASAAEEPDSLRRADGLTLRRLGWSLQLRSAEILARDLDRTTWSEKRYRFYEFACSHILRPDKILEQIDYLARLISLAVSLADWQHAYRMYQRALRAIEQLEAAVGEGECRLNGQLVAATPRLWTDFRTWVANACREAVLRSVPWDSTAGRPSRLPRDAERLFSLIGMLEGTAEVGAVALSLREADWGKQPYKEHLRWDASEQRSPIEGEAEFLEMLDADSDQRRVGDLRAFIDSTQGEDPTTGLRRVNRRLGEKSAGALPSLMPYLLATRPYTAQEVALYRPDECVFGLREKAFERWGAYTRALRGAWHRPVMDQIDDCAVSWEASEQPEELRVADLGVGRAGRAILLGITSLETRPETWAAAAAGRPDRSTRRYDCLATIVNLAINAKPRPTHLLLPELSVPDRWLPTITSRLLESGISLITGLDYEHYANDQIGSSAALVLKDDRLGFASSIQIRQPKLEAAPGEEEDLYRSYGKTWKDWPEAIRQHPLYVHEGIHFGVLVCSELQNIAHRKAFQGNVDLLTILSWNKDLETFSSLVESASLDVHAYIALVNNRIYGDSRVRSPRRQAFERDICRLRGGENEQLVVVKIDPAQLRGEQSRHRRWPTSKDRYKPRPEGFRLLDRRKTIPR